MAGRQKHGASIVAAALLCSAAQGSLKSIVAEFGSFAELYSDERAETPRFGRPCLPWLDEEDFDNREGLLEDSGFHRDSHAPELLIVPERSRVERPFIPKGSR